MKRLATLFLLTAFLFNGCLLTSFHPFYKKSDLTVNDALLGDWIGNKTLLSFYQLNEMSYLVNYKSCEDPITNPDDYSACTMADFTVHLMKLGDHFYLDFYPRSYAATDNLFSNLHIKPTHSLARLTITNDQLEIRMLNYNWVSNYLEKNSSKLSHILIDDLVTLTAPTEDLQAFILKHQDEPGFFDQAHVLKKK